MAILLNLQAANGRRDGLSYCLRWNLIFDQSAFSSPLFFLFAEKQMSRHWRKERLSENHTVVTGIEPARSLSLCVYYRATSTT